MQFGKIEGHQQIKNRLLSSVKNNKIAHAQLFWGNEGGAGLALAWAYANYVLCENKQENDSCGICSSCLKSQKLIHPDLNFVFPVSTTTKVKSKALSRDFIAEWRSFLLENPYQSLTTWLEKIGAENKKGLISVEETRNVIKNISMKPFESEYKTLIFWLPEKMNVQSANAILKILEEPSPKTLFLMVCQEPEKLLSTIISRVQMLQVPNFEDEEVEKTLVNCFDITAEDAKKLAYLSNGNISKALILFAQNEDEIHAFFLNWMRSCFKKDFTQIVKFGDEFSKFSKSLQKTMFNYALESLRESLLYINRGENLLKVSNAKKQFIEGFSKVLTPSVIQVFYHKVNEALLQLERNASPKIIFAHVSISFVDSL